MNTGLEKDKKDEELNRIDNFAVFTENEIRRRIEIGKTYRPAYYSILIIKEGGLLLKHNLLEYSVGKNSLVFVRPNSVYEFSRMTPDFKVAGLIYNREFLSRSGIHLNRSSILETFATGFQPFYSISQEEVESLLVLLKLLKTSLKKDKATAFIFEVRKHCFLTFFYSAISVYRQYNAAYKVKLNRPQELSIDFLRLLGTHFKEERSLQFYADLLFVTPKHLSQTLKDTTGYTAGEFIDRAIITEAQILLRNPAYNVAQVAEELNFSDQFFFAKFFKKHTGLTPTQYRTVS